MKFWMFAAWTAIGILAGCAEATSIRESEIARFYAMAKGGFSERLTLDLKKDGRYELNHRLIADSIGPDGVIRITHGIEEGQWRLERGQVTLTPSAQTPDFLNAPVFVPAVARKLIPKRDGSLFQLVSADFSEGFMMKETKPWDQSKDPFFQPK